MRTVGYKPPKQAKKPAAAKPPKPEPPKTGSDKPEAQGNG